MRIFAVEQEAVRVVHAAVRQHLPVTHIVRDSIDICACQTAAVAAQLRVCALFRLGVQIGLTVASLLTGILLAAGILQVVDALLINIIPRLKEIADFSIMNYLSSGNVGLLSMASGGSLYLKALLIAIITLILMGSLSGLMMQKKDI